MDAKTDNLPTSCQQAALALSALFDETATSDERRLARTHLQTCADCARMWAQWEDLRDITCSVQQSADRADHSLIFAPVLPPRHLKKSILRQTSHQKTPLWQFAWPRAVLGGAIPVVLIAGWIGFATLRQSAVPTPGSSVSIPTTPATPQPEIVAEMPALPDSPDASAAIDAPPQIQPVVDESALIEEVAPRRERRSMRRVAPRRYATTAARPAKSTFTRRRNQNAMRVRGAGRSTPQISLVAANRPLSRPIDGRRPIAPRPIVRTASPDRITAPRLAEMKTDSARSARRHGTEGGGMHDTDYVAEYIEARDVRPDNIRQAVDSYRAALLDVHDDVNF